jgi:hypothetical protein
MRCKKTKTYNRRDSQMVTHSSTSRPVQCLCMAERTGCPVLTDLWSYVSFTRQLCYRKMSCFLRSCGISTDKHRHINQVTNYPHLTHLAPPNSFPISLSLQLSTATQPLSPPPFPSPPNTSLNPSTKSPNLKPPSLDTTHLCLLFTTP